MSQSLYSHSEYAFLQPRGLIDLYIDPAVIMHQYNNTPAIAEEQSHSLFLFGRVALSPLGWKEYFLHYVLSLSR